MKRILTALIALLVFGGIVGALTVPALSGRVVDDANVVSSGTERDLDAYLSALEDETGIQIAVLTIPSLEGESLEDYSIRVVDQWQLGSADDDNGALLLVALQEKKVRIEVGYGLEGVLTDVKSGLIIREIIKPYFAAGDFDGGISAAVQTMGEVASGRSDIAVPAQRTTSTQSGGAGIGFFVNILVFMFIAGLGRFGRRRRYGGFGRALFWSSVASSAMRGRSSRGGFGGGGFSGGGGFGGFSGGGGGFGGGGASGGW